MGDVRRLRFSQLGDRLAIERRGDQEGRVWSLARRSLDVPTREIAFASFHEGLDTCCDGKATGSTGFVAAVEPVVEKEGEGEEKAEGSETGGPDGDLRAGNAVEGVATMEHRGG